MVFSPNGSAERRRQYRGSRHTVQATSVLLFSRVDLSISLIAGGIKGGVVSIKITRIQMLLGNSESIAKALIVYDLALAQITQGIAYIGVVAKTNQIVVGCTRFLLCCNSKSASFCAAEQRNPPLRVGEIDFVDEILRGRMKFASTASGWISFHRSIGFDFIRAKRGFHYFPNSDRPYQKIEVIQWQKTQKNQQTYLSKNRQSAVAQ